MIRRTGEAMGETVEATLTSETTNGKTLGSAVGHVRWSGRALLLRENDCQIAPCGDWRPDQ